VGVCSESADGASDEFGAALPSGAGWLANAKAPFAACDSTVAGATGVEAVWTDAGVGEDSGTPTRTPIFFDSLGRGKTVAMDSGNSTAATTAAASKSAPNANAVRNKRRGRACVGRGTVVLNGTPYRSANWSRRSIFSRQLRIISPRTTRSFG